MGSLNMIERLIGNNAVMHQDRRIADLDHTVHAAAVAGLSGDDVEVVVVVAGDSEVPHPAAMVLRSSAAVGDRSPAVSSLEGFAFAEFGGRNPLPQVPEQVVAGGVDDLGAATGLNGEVVEVSVVVELRRQ